MRILLFLALALSFGWSSMALAQSQTPTQSTFDFTQPLVGLDGKPQKDSGMKPTPDDPNCDRCVISLGQAAAMCLYVDPTAKEAKKKTDEYALANRIIGNKAASLDSHAITVIEDCVGSNSTPIVAGQIYHLLEPDKYPDK